MTDRFDRLALRDEPLPVDLVLFQHRPPPAALSQRFGIKMIGFMDLKYDGLRRAERDRAHRRNIQAIDVSIDASRERQCRRRRMRLALVAAQVYQNVELRHGRSPPCLAHSLRRARPYAMPRRANRQ
jgi:hypothetical protein